jgi:hypothetical protein
MAKTEDNPLARMFEDAQSKMGQAPAWDAITLLGESWPGRAGDTAEPMLQRVARIDDSIGWRARDVRRAQADNIAAADQTIQGLQRLLRESQAGALSAESQRMRARLHRYFGVSDPTPPQLTDLMGHIQHQRYVLADDGRDGYVIQGRHLGDLQTQASREHWDRPVSRDTLLVTPLNGRTMYLNLDARALDDPGALDHGIGHDALHPGPGGVRDEMYGGQYAYFGGEQPQRDAFSDMIAHAPDQALRNADNIYAFVRQSDIPAEQRGRGLYRR